MSSWLKSDANKILLTEGDTDCHVIASLCSHYQLETDLFGFFSCGSDTKVLKKANALLSLDGEQQKTNNRHCARCRYKCCFSLGSYKK